MALCSFKQYIYIYSINLIVRGLTPVSKDHSSIRFHDIISLAACKYNIIFLPPHNYNIRSLSLHFSCTKGHVRVVRCL
jgi:hypothetical protein